MTLKKITDFIKLKKLYISLTLILFSGIFVRFFFFYYTPLPEFYADAVSYGELATKIFSGELPLFHWRAPLYPIFIAVVNFFDESLISLFFAQSLLTISTAMLVVYWIHKSIPKITYYVTIAFLLFICSNRSIYFDNAIFAESLYTNIIILFFGSMVYGIVKDSRKAWIGASTFFGLLILVRPSGLFLVPLLALIILYMLWNNKGYRMIVSLILPGGLIILSLAAYNKGTFGQFSLSASGPINLLGTTLTYQNTSHEYPENVNKAIQEELFDKIPQREIDLVRNSYNLDTLKRVFGENYLRLTPLYGKIAQGIYDDPSHMVVINPILSKMTKNAISEHPELYFKFFIAMFYEFFTCFPDRDYFFYAGNIPMRYHSFYVDTHLFDVDWTFQTNGVITEWQKKVTFKEFAQDECPYDFEESYAKLQSNIFFKVYDWYWYNIHQVLFRNILWVVLFFITFLYALIINVKYRFKDKAALIVLSICLINILSGVLISMVEEILPQRYPFPTEFCYFMVVAFLPLLLMRKKYLIKN